MATQEKDRAAGRYQLNVTLPAAAEADVALVVDRLNVKAEEQGIPASVTPSSWARQALLDAVRSALDTDTSKEDAR